MSTGAPDVNDVDDNVTTPPPPVAVTSPSNTTAPSRSANRAQPAVPVATAFTDAGSVNVAEPPDAEPNAGFANTTVASNVPDAAVAGVAGCEPV
jgi:hypothetical protein